MVIERGGAFVEAARVPGIAKSKTVEVQMMAELMTESAQKRSERGDLFANCRSHPDPDQHRRWVVVSEKLDRGVFPDAQGSSGKHSDGASPDLVKIGGGCEKLCAGSTNVCDGIRLHCRLDGLGNSRQSPISWQRECLQPVTVGKEFAIFLAWWRVGQHPKAYSAINRSFPPRPSSLPLIGGMSEGRGTRSGGSIRSDRFTHPTGKRRHSRTYVYIRTGTTIRTGGRLVRTAQLDSCKCLKRTA